MLLELLGELNQAIERQINFKTLFNSYENALKFNPNDLFAKDKILLLKMKFNKNYQLKVI